MRPRRSRPVTDRRCRGRGNRAPRCKYSLYAALLCLPRTISGLPSAFQRFSIQVFHLVAKASLGSRRCERLFPTVQPDPHPLDAPGGGPCVDPDARRLRAVGGGGDNSASVPGHAIGPHPDVRSPLQQPPAGAGSGLGRSCVRYPLAARRLSDTVPEGQCGCEARTLMTQTGLSAGAQHGCAEQSTHNAFGNWTAAHRGRMA